MLRGAKHSQETKQIVREAHKGKHYSPRTELKKGNKGNLGRRPSEEARKKMSKTWFQKGFVPWNTGRKTPPETRQKLSRAMRGHVPWNKGKKMSEETKQKLSIALRGVHRSPGTEFRKGQYAGNKNPAKLAEVRKKIGAQKRGRPLFNLRKGNHPRWKGGITPKNEALRKGLEYKLWRRGVFSRDNWMCRKRGVRGGNLHAHHLNSFAKFNKLQTSLKNGVTLCKHCHAEFHRTYGAGDNTEEQFERFLTLLSSPLGGETRNAFDNLHALE